MKKSLFLLAALLYAGLLHTRALTIDFTPSHNIESCGPNDVYFVCVQPQSPDYVLWDFGDGETSNTLAPVHHYATAGHYKVKLVVIEGGVKDSLVRDSFVVIKPAPLAKFLLDSSQVQEQRVRTFIDISEQLSDSIISRIWNFGDGHGDTVAGKRIRVYFPDTGLFIVKLTVLNSVGCTDSFSDSVRVDNNGVLPAGIARTKAGNQAGFAVYPNPSQGQLRVTPQAVNSDITVSFYTITGTELQRHHFRDAQELAGHAFDVSAFAPGIYFVECDAASLHTVTRFSKY